MQHVAPPRFVDELLDLIAVHAQHAHHAAGRGIGGVLHRLATDLNDAQAGIEIQRAGKNQGGVFAETQSGGGGTRLDDRRIVLFQLLERCQTAHEQRGLAVNRRVELFSGTVGAEFQQVVAQDVGRAGKEFLGAGQRRGKRGPHADGLGPLTRKEKGSFGHGRLPYVKIEDKPRDCLSWVG